MQQVSAEFHGGPMDRDRLLVEIPVIGPLAPWTDSVTGAVYYPGVRLEGPYRQLVFIWEDWFHSAA